MSKTHWKQNFDYRYTGAYELGIGEEKVLTISKISKEGVMSTNGKEELCTVAHFKEASKPMVLNKTNCKTIAKLYGSYLEDWAGKQIIIKSERVKAFGENVDALRVKLSKPKIDIDCSAQIKTIQACKTVDELKKVYSSLSKDEKNVCYYAKDAMKEKLEKENSQ